MNDVFELIGSNLIISWDPEELTKDFSVIVDEKDRVISLPNGKPHWQYFNSGIHFSRNFNIAFPKQCQEIIDILTVLQNNLRTSTPSSLITDVFLKHKLDINKVLVIKVACGKNVDLHYDRTRPFSINIGLKNSDTCLTHVYSGEKVGNGLINENNVKHTLKMRDGDAYLITTSQPHSVESLVSCNESKDRYIISYCLI